MLVRLSISLRQNFALTLGVAVALCLASCKKDLWKPSMIQPGYSGTNFSLYAVAQLGNSMLLACGGYIWTNTVVLKSTNGGLTWDTVAVPYVGKAMFGLSVTNSNSIYMCGVDGAVIYSADAGKTWKLGRIGDWGHYVSGTFVAADTGLFVSTVLQRECTITMVDSNFKTLKQQTFQFGLNGLKMAGTGVGYVYGYGTMMKTVDNGASWNLLDVVGDNFTGLDIHGDNLMMCGYNGSVYHSADAGKSWEKLRNGSDPTIPHYGLLSILFADSNNGWLSCDNGKVLYTNNGGHDWMEYPQFTTAALRAMTRLNDGTLVLVGDNGAVYRLTP